MNCLLGDAGIAICLTSLPFRQEMEFYEREIKGSLFPNYKNAVLKNFSSEPTSKPYSDFHQHFYKPVPYYLFGSFDLAVITLVDDFEMTARTFRPFDPMFSLEENKSYPENFFYKVITGPTPRFNPKDSIVDLAARTFLGDNRLPLFAMSLLKLNNALLLGTGTEFLRSVVRFVRHAAKQHQLKNQDLQVILLESHSAHEITLLIFTNSYRSAARLITWVREARMRDLLEAGTAVLSAEESTSLLNNCVLANLPNGSDNRDVFSATLFADTESYFGFDFNLLNPERRSALLERIDANDSLDMYCQWSVRPGYLQASIDELAHMNTQAVRTRIGGALQRWFGRWWRRENTQAVRTCIGRGDLFEQTKDVPTRRLIEQVLNSLHPKSLPKHARRRQTMPAWAGNDLDLAVEADNSEGNFEKEISRLPFSIKEIKDIEDSLRAVWAPKILMGKVLNAFTNFNDGILDPSLFGYFLELLPLMESIQKKVASWKDSCQETHLGEICGTLEKITDNFERAYRNRFYNSYRMGDITDFNLDFKGGIQQLLTSFDAAYKSICSVLGRPESFVYVAGSPGVYSTRYEVRLNYYHVFQPEIFCCIANHEAANFYLSRSGEDIRAFAEASGLNIFVGPSDSNPFKGRCLDRLLKMQSGANSERKALLSLVTPLLLRFVFVDLLAFYFGYNKNTQLFAHWYWGYFAQNSFAYSRKEKVDEIQFVEFMLRMIWIERITNVPPVEAISFGNEFFDKLWHKWRPKLLAFLEWLFADDQTSEWNDLVLSHVETKFLEVYPPSGSESIARICIRVEEEAAELRKKLERGEVCIYSRVDDKSMFRFTEQLFYAYLSLLKDRFGVGEILLTRRSEGIPHLKPTNSKALFDPIGGIFTHDPVTRRERFKYRAGLTMSLWDMAQKEKKGLLLKRLTRPTGLQ